MNLSSVASAGVLMVLTAPVGFCQTSPNPAKPAKPATAVTHTRDGHPDLQGIWSFATLTPLERPAALAGKTRLTDQEAADFAKRTIAGRNFDRRDGGADADVSRAYNDLFYDFGKNASNQTSLIVDPADGKLPYDRSRPEKGCRARREIGPRSRGAGGPAALGALHPGLQFRPAHHAQWLQQ